MQAWGGEGGKCSAVVCGAYVVKALRVLEWRQGDVSSCHLSLALFLILKRERSNPREGMQ